MGLRISAALLVVALIATACGDGDDDGESEETTAATVESLVQFESGESPEGIVISDSGDMYVSVRATSSGERVSRIVQVSPDGMVADVAELPASPGGANGALGLAIDSMGAIYVALDSRDPSTSGIWRVDPDNGSVDRVTGSEAMQFPNALTFDSDGNLYATDSLGGSVWRAEPGGAFEQWAEDQLLEPSSENPFGFEGPGANGIVFAPPNRLFVANTERGLVAEISIDPDGAAASVELLVEGTDDVPLLAIDGLTMVDETIYGVLAAFPDVGSSPIVAIDAATSTATPLPIDRSDGDLFDVPLSLHAARDPWLPAGLYVTNGDLNGSSSGPGPGVVSVGTDA